ncbi:cadherin-like domain-containing protein [Tahibacter soli]|uniref:Ig-like domain-containing protein n=1 Tax=Tahibacter soli TaxID=2983605 RepID=A0A9X3YS37_9GAMM|nr:Ig-like domain-containing protein [Tahibacter soli]MDC8016113.1 Ig-like domain-containing protein [Tahibacter soli]
MKILALAGCIAAVLFGTSALAAPAIVVTARSGDPGAPERLADGVADRGRHTLAVDAAGNTYVVGSRWNGTDWRYRTTKYAPDGSVAWNAMQPPETENPGQFPYGVGVDAAGNVYVTGTNYVQFVTIKYDSAGTQQWLRRYSFPGGVYQQPRAMAVDAAGNVYVTGRSQAGGAGIDQFDYGTVKYDTDGNELWTARYNGPDGLQDEVLALALDPDGNVYVTGGSKGAGGRNDYATVKYDASGVQQWASRYGNGRHGDQANAVVVNGDSVVVTGISNTGDHYDAITVGYDRATGVQQWTATVTGPHNNYGSALVRDGQGNVYLAGAAWNPGNGLTTAKFDAAGTQQWLRNYLPYSGITGSNIAYAVALDPTGGVVSAGRATGFDGFDYGVVKYDDAGTQLWTQLFNGPPGTLTDEAGAVAVRNDGVVVVAGTEGYSQGSTGNDRRTTLFIVDGVQATSPRIGIAPSVTGEPYAVNVSVRGKVGFPAGSVLVSDGDGHSCGIALANGDGACTLANATAGGKTVTATFSSDAPALFASSANATTHVVNKATTRLTVATPGLSRPGEAFDASVDFGIVAPGAGTTTGDITVGDGVDSCTIAPPATHCALTLTTAGARTIAASYAGDANFLAVGASVAHRVNRVATTTADSYSLAEDGSLTVASAAGVLANDDDADGDTLAVVPGTFAAGGIGGTVVLHADGSFDYTPPADANGTATFAYTAGDGAESATGSVEIQVRPVNDPPSFTLGANLTHAAATSGAQSVAGFAGGVSTGPADEAGQSIDAFATTVDSDPNDIVSTVGIDASGNLSYTLTGRGGTATIGVRARDNGGTGDGGNDTSAARTFTITVASGVDLAIGVSNGRSFIVGGSETTYAVDVRNLGPDTANQARVSVAQPGNVIAFVWTCSRSDATPCAVAAGTGAMEQFVNVPVGVTVTFAFTMTVLSQPESPVTLQAFVAPAASQTEVQPANNSASDTDPVGIFASGFEG